MGPPEEPVYETPSPSITPLPVRLPAPAPVPTQSEKPKGILKNSKVGSTWEPPPLAEADFPPEQPSPSPSPSPTISITRVRAPAPAPTESDEREATCSGDCCFAYFVTYCLVTIFIGSILYNALYPEECTTTSDCWFDDWCESGRCINCSSDSDCDSGWDCHEGRCLAPSESRRGLRFGNLTIFNTTKTD